jgi:hypothetical protein
MAPSAQKKGDNSRYKKFDVFLRAGGFSYSLEVLHAGQRKYLLLFTAKI